MGSFNMDDGDSSGNVTFKLNWWFFFSIFVALIPVR